METRKILRNIAIEENGKWGAILYDLQNKKFPNTDIDYPYDFITLVDETYPERLKQSYHPPFVLFYKGNLTLLNRTDLIGVAMDGNETNGYEFSKDKHYIAFGLNKTIIDNTKELIVVLETEISNTELVNKVLANGGLVITENTTTEPDINSARIVSGLENELLVVNSKKRMASAIQVMCSLNTGHDITVVPTSIHTDSENNRYISEGANIYLAE